jgi:hypothetical protein
MAWPSVNWASGSVASLADEAPSELITRADFAFSRSKFVTQPPSPRKVARSTAITSRKDYTHFSTGQLAIKR